MVTVFRDGSHRFGTHLIFHFLPPYSPAPFFQTQVIYSENGKKPPFPLKEERLIIGRWLPAPFLKMKKAGILMASRHKNPGRFKNDNFLKTL